MLKKYQSLQFRLIQKENQLNNMKLEIEKAINNTSNPQYIITKLISPFLKNVNQNFKQIKQLMKNLKKIPQDFSQICNLMVSFYQNYYEKKINQIYIQQKQALNMLQSQNLVLKKSNQILKQFIEERKLLQSNFSDIFSKNEINHANQNKSKTEQKIETFGSLSFHQEVLALKNQLNQFCHQNNYQQTQSQVSRFNPFSTQEPIKTDIFTELLAQKSSSAIKNQKEVQINESDRLFFRQTFGIENENPINSQRQFLSYRKQQIKLSIQTKIENIQERIFKDLNFCNSTSHTPKVNIKNKCKIQEISSQKRKNSFYGKSSQKIAQLRKKIGYQRKNYLNND